VAIAVVVAVAASDGCSKPWCGRRSEAEWGANGEGKRDNTTLKGLVTLEWARAAPGWPGVESKAAPTWPETQELPE
jgi:hypothetical protein